MWIDISSWYNQNKQFHSNAEEEWKKSRDLEICFASILSLDFSFLPLCIQTVSSFRIMNKKKEKNLNTQSETFFSCVHCRNYLKMLSHTHTHNQNNDANNFSFGMKKDMNKKTAKRFF